MPLSSDPDKRARQLANLKPGAGQWKAGAAPHVRSGWRTRRPPPLLFDPVVAELADVLAADAPLRDADGELPAADRAAVESAAIDLLIVRRVHGFLQTKGWEDERGERLRPEVEHLGKANARLLGKLAQLGMTPTARSRLGLDIARTVDLATAMSEPDPERRALLMRAAGMPVDGDREAS